MPVYKGWNAKIYYEGVEIGYVTEVRIEVDHSVEPYFEVFNRQASTLIEGPIQIMGRMRRAWVDITYLSLLTSTGTLSSFDLAVKVGSQGPIVYLYNCKFKKGTIAIPQDGFLTEDYDFIATSLATSKAPFNCSGELIFSSGFEAGDYSEWDRHEDETVLSIDNVVKYEGNYSSKIEGDSWYPGYSQKDLTLESGKTYCLSGYFRCDSFDFSSMGEPWEDYIDNVLGFQDDQGNPYAASNGLFFTLQGAGENVLKLKLCYRRDASSEFIDTGLTLETGKWYAIAIEVYVHDSSGYVKLYIDGELKASKTACNTTGMLRFSAGSATSIWATDLATRTQWVDIIKLYRS